MSQHDYFKGGSFIRSAVYGLPKIKQPLRYVPWCTGVYRKHLRYLPYSIGVFRHQGWFTIRNNSIEPTERQDSKLRFLWNNLWDTATLTASSEQTRFPASNTQQHWLSNCWRSGLGEIEDVWLKGDLGEKKTVKAFVLANHWFNPGSTVRIQANNADAWGAPAVNEVLEITNSKNLIEKCWTEEHNYRYWRVLMNSEELSGALVGEEDINTRGDKDLVPYCNPHFKVGRIFLGDFSEMSQNFRRHYPKYKEDARESKADRKGFITEHPAWKYRLFFYIFNRLGSVDYNLIWNIYESLGKGIPFFICENYQYWWKKTFYVTFAEDLDYDYENNRVTTVLKLRETH